jgi:DNA ligase-associated metallophosphoesterase
VFSRFVLFMPYADCIADMDGCAFALAGARLVARPSGALWVPAARLLVAADLHLGKAERLARRGGGLLPPYETEETLSRLAAEVAALAPETVLLLGDSFDDGRAAEALDDESRARIAALAAGRRWVWAAGNHDPAPLGLPGTHALEWRTGPLICRHVAARDAPAGEVSAHFHPKASLETRGRRVRRRCFLADERRVILPAFGAYTGGLDATDAVFDPLLGPDARALLLGRKVVAVPRAALAVR